MKPILCKAQRMQLEGQFIERDSINKVVYDNQITAANEVVKNFMDGYNVNTLIGMMGSGKTNTFMYVSYLMCMNKDDKKIIPKDNVYVLTGMSDLDWKVQTTKNFLPAFSQNIYHRTNLKTLEKKWETKGSISDTLIIVDECHIGTKSDHTLSIFLQRWIKNVQYMIDNRVYLLLVSATPANVLLDAENLNCHKKVFLKPSSIYKGLHFLHKNDLIKDSISLCEPENVEEIENVIKERWGDNNARYHIIRFPSALSKFQEMRAAAIVKAAIKDMCDKNDWKYELHTSEDRIKNIDDILSKKPSKHTFILIKNFWYCAKRLIVKWVGICYENKCKAFDSNTISQGLCGRFCGNYKEEIDVKKCPIFYSNLKGIEEYIDWIDNGCDYRAVEKYHSKNLTKIDERVRIVPSFVTSIKKHVKMSRMDDSEEEIEELELA